MANSKKETLYALANASRCYGCDIRLQEDDIVKLENKANAKEVYCVCCSNLNDFEFLKKGNQKLTRLAKKYSRTHFVILKWSKLWKAYERLGIFVESKALEKAKLEIEKQA